jgi:Relaxase/Mobilisation nuclease domain
VIINGGSRRKWKRFAVHLANEKDNERVHLVEVRGMKADSVKEGFTKLQAMADMAGAGEKEFYYHANLNPMEHEELTPEQWEEASERLRRNLGLEGQPGMVIEHVKGGRTHRHHIDLRIDLDTGKLISDGWNYARHEKTARELERAFDLGKVQGALVECDGPRPERRPEKWEVQRGKRSGIDPQDVKEEVTGLWNTTESGAAFRTALAQRGYVLAQGDRRDFCIIDAQAMSIAWRVASRAREPRTFASAWRTSTARNCRMWAKEGRSAGRTSDASERRWTSVRIEAASRPR